MPWCTGIVVLPWCQHCTGIVVLPWCQHCTGIVQDADVLLDKWIIIDYMIMPSFPHLGLIQLLCLIWLHYLQGVLLTFLGGLLFSVASAWKGAPRLWTALSYKVSRQVMMLYHVPVSSFRYCYLRLILNDPNYYSDLLVWQLISCCITTCNCRDVTNIRKDSRQG